MSLRSAEVKELEEAGSDPHRALVDRIVASPKFTRSERLTSFLLCICELSREGREDEISEQYIGRHVFGRRADFDAGADSIVRSHASRLRHRLHQYFQEEGREEAWVLTVPKGSYLPVFLPRELEPAAEEDELTTEDPAPAFAEEKPVTPAIPEGRDLAERRTFSALRGWLIAGWIVAALSMVTAGAALWKLTHPAGWTAESRRIFWSGLFNGTDHTLVVIADSGLVMLQNATKKRVTLPMYLNGSYLAALGGDQPDNSPAKDYGARRYTSYVDLTVAVQILRLTGVELGNTRFAYARDLRPNELKSGNLFLIGTYESTPWVQLFEPAMNFYFRNDLAQGNFVLVNRQPRPGEQPTYTSRSDDPEKTVYGVIAYRPALDGVGRVLILEGQTMAGTASASDFIFDDAYFLPFLKSIRRQNGSLPYFEVLVRSTNMGGDASNLEILAKRVEER